MMKPPGSRPGISSFAMIPARRPIINVPMIDMAGPVCNWRLRGLNAEAAVWFQGESRHCAAVSLSSGRIDPIEFVEALEPAPLFPLGMRLSSSGLACAERRSDHLRSRPQDQ